MPLSLLACTTDAIFAVICLIALWKGDVWKRVVGGLLLVAVILPPLLQDRLDFTDSRTRLLCVDLVLLVCLTGLAIQVGKPWMMVCAAFQLDATLICPAANFFRVIGPFADVSLPQLFSCGCYLTLGAAVLWDLRRAMPAAGASFPRPGWARLR